MNYLISFNGRRIGAIGVFHEMAATVTLKKEYSNKDELRDALIIELYNDYDHITRVSIS